MLTNKDIQKLMVAFTTVFATKEDLENLENRIHTKLNSLMDSADTYFQEMVMLSHKVNFHEKWLRQIVDNLGIKLYYAT